MDAYEPDKNKPSVILEFCNHPVLVATNVEYDPAISYGVSSFEQLNYLIRVFKVCFLYHVKPRL